MKNRVITISREFGSGGRTIGRKTAEKLGIPCYDAEIIQTMVQETGFAPDYVQEAGEYAPGGFLSSAFSNRMFGPTNEDILWEHQYKVITDLAAKGPCVIVGRCADYILQDTALGATNDFTVSMRTWRSVPSASWRSTASGSSPRRSVCGIRTSAGRRITASTPT